jgi:hypothetical protein
VISDVELSVMVENLRVASVLFSSVVYSF